MDSQASDRACSQYLDDPSLEAEQCNRCRQGNQCRGPIEVVGEALWPKHVVPKEQSQVENHADHADHGGSDGRQGRGELGQRLNCKHY